MRNIYLDHGASTPVRPEVIEAMLPHWTKDYGNASSVHLHGRLAHRHLEEGRAQIARLLGAQPDEIIFTGCGSESDNLALRGVMAAARQRGQGNHLITSAIEHKAVLGTARQLEDMYGFEVSVLPVDQAGQISLDDLEAAIRPDTVLISIMAASNEIGTYQPIDEIGRVARLHGILFHSDAIQAIAFRRWDLDNMPIDLLSLAPHKFYGPKGVGILYARRGLELIGSLTGGSQEQGWRAGTVNVPFAVGASEALRLAMSELEQTVEHCQKLRDRLIAGILAAFPEECVLTGHPELRLPNNASFAFQGISGNELLMHLDLAGISASSGSACLTGDPKPAEVLEALGLGSEWTRGGLRLTVGRQNTSEEVDYVLESLPGIIARLHRFQARYAPLDSQGTDTSQ